MPALLVSAVGVVGSRRRKILGYGLLLVLISGCLLQSACSGGMTAGNGGSTSPGTYNIVVTGTSNAVTQTTAITMILR
jgi:preprotein translocase subunit SecG